MHHIVVCEDDINIRELIVYALNNSGFKATGLNGARELRDFFQSNDPDLLILDLMLDGESGYEILTKIRNDKDRRDLPVIILTAKTSEFDKVKGLDMGADDYVTKPFGVMELISRIKALLRRVPEKAHNVNLLTYGSLVVNLENREVFLDGKSIDLTYKEFELLVYLLENQDKVLSRDKIMSRVWGYDYMGETRTVDVHIRSLRTKLEDKADLIKTVRNIGYKLGA